MLKEITKEEYDLKEGNVHSLITSNSIVYYKEVE
tara:strand:- start:424 stop:525 length:102 start_codon:yes stop_codon:yes gene_type:complete